MTEKEKYLAWHKDQVENHGLKSVRIFGNPLADFDENVPRVPEGTTEEDIFRSMNQMNAAYERGDYEELKDL